MEDCGKSLDENEHETYKDVIDEYIERLRTFGIIHNDLDSRDGKYPNIMKRDDEIRLIDFHVCEEDDSLLTKRARRQ